MTRPYVWCCSVFAALAVASPLSADWVEDFSSGTFNQPWLFFDDGAAIPPDASIVDPGAGNLIIGGDASRLPSFDSFVVGLVGVGNPAFKFSDVRHRAIVSAFENFNFAGSVSQGNNDNFIMVRNQGGVESYLLALDFNNGDVDLVRIDAGPAIIGLGGGSSSSVPGFNPAGAYTLELIATGPTLTGNVYDGPDLVATVGAVDATYSMGWSGLGAAINDNDDIGGPGGPGRTLLAVQFDDVSSRSPPVMTPGDIDLDGDVDRTDVALFNQHFGTSAGAVWTTGDFNDDERTTLADLNLVQINLGPSSASPIAPVPEPATLWLMVAAVAGAAAMARRRVT